MKLDLGRDLRKSARRAAKYARRNYLLDSNPDIPYGLIIGALVDELSSRFSQSVDISVEGELRFLFRMVDWRAETNERLRWHSVAGGTSPLQLLLNTVLRGQPS